jgi:hypothetical protein
VSKSAGRGFNRNTKVQGFLLQLLFFEVSKPLLYSVALKAGCLYQEILHSIIFFVFMGIYKFLYHIPGS